VQGGLDRNAAGVYICGMGKRRDQRKALKLLGDNLYQLRWNAQMRQEELAQRSGISRVTISGIERGVVDPHVSTLVALAAGIGVHVTLLLLEEE